MEKELDDKVYQQLTAHTDKGNALCDAEDYPAALREFEAALALIPAPLENWEAATWVLSAMGDCYFFLDDYERTRQCFAQAVTCPDGLGNWFIHLRLGEAQFELGNEERAKDELARAYMGHGRDAFASEDPKYFRFLKKHMRHI